MRDPGRAKFGDECADARIGFAADAPIVGDRGVNTFVELIGEEFGEVFEIVDGLVDESDGIGEHGRFLEKTRAVFIYSFAIPSQVPVDKLLISLKIVPTKKR